MKILFFSPHNYYLVHALPEALVAESLKTKGSEIIYVGCNGILNNYCLCMSAIASNSNVSQKELICKTCKLYRDKIYNEFNLKSIMIDDFISDLDRIEINNLINNIDRSNIENFKYLNYDVGKISLYEFLLNRKLNTTKLNLEEYDELKLYLKNTLIVLFAGSKIFESYKLDRLVTYNSFYSVNNMMCSIASRNNIPHYMLHAGSHHKYRLTEMTIFKGLSAPFLINENEKWFEFSKYPISKNYAQKAFEHVIYLLKTNSPWVYSIKSNRISELNLKLKFGVKSNQKILLALMSSADERFSANLIGALPIYPASFFSSQLEWITYLIELAKSDKNIFLIIRVHPREFPNKREKVLSKQAEELTSIFSTLPTNCHINYPSDNISLHDIIKITDVGLNGTTTAGLELLLFGIPVIIYDENQLFSYPREINLIANNVIDYKIKIYQAIDSGMDIKYIVSAFRWIAYKSEVVSIDISDGYTTKYNLFKKYIIYFLNKFFKTSYFISLKNRNKPLDEIDKLTYAIFNNQVSHIEKFQVNKTNNIDIEKIIIINYFKKYLNIILHKNDILFKMKVHNMIYKN
jgi:hypothetical protein